MEKWSRLKYMPVMPLGKDGKLVTCCDEHTAFTKKAAEEGMVLLKNNGILPLKKGEKIAVFGKAQIDYIRGISPFIPKNRIYSVIEYLEEICKSGEAELFGKTTGFYRKALNREECTNDGGLGVTGKSFIRGKEAEPEIPEELVAEAADFADTAIITICRYQQENIDRKAEEFYLVENEKLMIERVCKHFDRVVAILNIGAQIETDWIAENDKIGAALNIWYPGLEGGKATVDVLFGKANPSGKLVDTFAKEYSDYPSSRWFDASETQVKYYEDIYVGYRYFETVPGAADRVNYPFGFGLSYTTFEFSGISARADNEKIYIKATVENTGNVAGKEVVQIYYSAPQGRLGKPAKELAVFAKSALLAPGEKQSFDLEFSIAEMASYDDCGKCAKSAYVLEKGDYRFFVGNSVRDVEQTEFVYTVEEDFRIVEQLSPQAEPILLEKRMIADGTFEELPLGEPKKPPYPQRLPIIPRKVSEKRIMFNEVYEGKASMDDFIAQLDREYMLKLLGGKPSRGVCITNGIGGECRHMTDAVDEYGVPCAMTCDAPEGLCIRFERQTPTTQFPASTMLACSWNLDILYEYGRIGGMELKENNIFVWLSPGINIHRDPLCGRNYEYFSEDPVIAGRMAAANVRGTQSVGVASNPKHFAVNNRETYRFNSDSIISERAMREIYLKAFEVCVKESDPWTIMTSYNLVNGVRVSESYDLLTNILRNEWGFKGLVITDWSNLSNHGKEICAGNDVRMPIGHYDTAEEYLDIHCMDKGMQYIQPCVRRLLEFLLKID